MCWWCRISTIVAGRSERIRERGRGGYLVNGRGDIRTIRCVSHCLSDTWKCLKARQVFSRQPVSPEVCSALLIKVLSWLDDSHLRPRFPASERQRGGEYE